jgi:hypothetical protein
MAIPYSTALFARPSSFTSIAGTIYEFGEIGKSYYIANTETHKTRTYTSPSAYRYDRNTLIAAADRVYRRNLRIVWMARLLTNRLPTPPMPAGAVESKHGVCDEFCKITHPLHSPKPAPTTVYRLRGKDAYWCAACCAAFDKAQAAYNRLNAPVRELEYTPLADAV